MLALELIAQSTVATTVNLRITPGFNIRDRNFPMSCVYLFESRASSLLIEVDILLNAGTGLARNRSPFCGEEKQRDDTACVYFQSAAEFAGRECRFPKITAQIGGRPRPYQAWSTHRVQQPCSPRAG